MDPKATLVIEAKKLSDELREVPGLQIKTAFVPWESDTRGYGCTVATWTGFPAVHLYFDRATGSNRFRFWAGFYASLRTKKLDRILDALPRNEVPKGEITEANIREVGGGDWIYKNPKESELGRPYVERYVDYGTCFYGFYDWGGHASKQLTLDTFKVAQFIRHAVESAGPENVKRNGRHIIADPEKRAAVEDEAIKAAKCFFTEKGFKVKSREADNCGWDIDVTKPGILLKAEVKGLSGNALKVELSPNEFDVMRKDPNYRVCIVSNALSPKLRKIRVFRPNGNRWIGDAGESLDVQERIAARLVVKLA